MDWAGGKRERKGEKMKKGKRRRECIHIYMHI
jgi:hypothetical protein